MDIGERALAKLKKAGVSALSEDVTQRVKVIGWETGLGPVFNALPGLFGQQAVLYFPGKSGKFAFPCCEHGGKVLLAVNAGEMESIADLLLQNPGVEVWLKNGWYAGTVRLLSAGEHDAVCAELNDEQFFGNIAKNLAKHSLKACSLLEVSRNAPCTGSSGPGSKAWVWPLAAGLLLFGRKKK